MEKSGNRWQNFIIGLLVGVIAGGAVVWLEMKDANRNFLSQIIYELNTLRLEKKIADAEIEKSIKEKDKQKLHSGKSAQQNKQEQSDKSTLTDSLQSEKIISDSLSATTQQDSVKKDTSHISLENTIISGNFQAENIVVKKDKLMYSKIIKLNVVDEVLQKNDSLISEISGVHKEDEKNEFSVEFWESPINYKGYKMANKKIILFGTGDEYESASLIQIDKKVYLKLNDAVYLLDATYNFAPFKKVTDKTLLAKIE